MHADGLDRPDTATCLSCSSSKASVERSGPAGHQASWFRGNENPRPNERGNWIFACPTCRGGMSCHCRCSTDLQRHSTKSFVQRIFAGHYPLYSRSVIHHRLDFCALHRTPNKCHFCVECNETALLQAKKPAFQRASVVRRCRRLRNCRVRQQPGTARSRLVEACTRRSE